MRKRKRRATKPRRRWPELTVSPRQNKIIGDSLKNNEAYLRYLWINDLANVKDRTVVYVPTEANLPIPEAGRGVEK